MIRSSVPRVLHVVRRLDFGGLQVEVLDLVRGLERLGFAQAVCCLEERGELADRLPGSVPVWECHGGGGAERLPRRAAHYIRSWRPDVLHPRNGAAWIDTAAAWLLAGRPGRLVFSIHGWDRRDRMPRRRAFLYRQLARMTRSLAAISAETARQFADESGIPPDRFAVLDSGVDTERFHPPALPRPEGEGRLVLGCVARLDPIKAHDLLIDAVARVVAGGHDLELRLLGDGPCRADLERRAQSHGLANRVRFAGMVYDIPEQLRALDLLVMASHREGRPISIMEAMATGLPVVATRVGSIPGLVADGRTGLLIEPGDIAGLSRAIDTLVNDGAMRRRFAEEARRVAVAELSLERMFDQYAAFYQGAVRDA